MHTNISSFSNIFSFCQCTYCFSHSPQYSLLLRSFFPLILFLFHLTPILFLFLTNLSFNITFFIFSYTPITTSIFPLLEFRSSFHNKVIYAQYSYAYIISVILIFRFFGSGFSVSFFLCHLFIF